MKQTEKTVITIETVQRTTIRFGKGAATVLCERCAAAAPSNAAARLQSVAAGAAQTGGLEAASGDKEKGVTK